MLCCCWLSFPSCVFTEFLLNVLLEVDTLQLVPIPSFTPTCKRRRCTKTHLPTPTWGWKTCATSPFLLGSEGNRQLCLSFPPFPASPALRLIFPGLHVGSREAFCFGLSGPMASRGCL